MRESDLEGNASVWPQFLRFFSWLLLGFAASFIETD